MTRPNALPASPPSRLESLDELRTFAAIVDAGSLTQAASRLGVTSNAVSRRLGMLEERLGRRLIHRTTRRLVVTEEGQRFYGRCLHILVELEEAEREVAGADGIQGTLRVGIQSEMVCPDLFSALGKMLNASSGLRVLLRVSPRFIHPMENGLDVAVYVGSPPSSSLVSTPLGRLVWVLAAAPSYLSRHGAPRTPRDLVKHECLRMVSDRPETHWELSRGTGRPQRFPVAGRFETEDSRALAGALDGGLGIGIRLRSVVEADADAGRLQRVLPEWQLASLPVYALTPQGRQRLPRVRALVELLRNTIRGLEPRAHR